MNHNISLVGFSYRLRPVTVHDASLIFNLRTDERRGRFLNPIRGDVFSQVRWLEDYLERPDDYYFVIENSLDGRAEGLISIYDIRQSVGEWGRWIVETGSSCAIESAMLIYRIAFTELALDSVYCRTLIDNERVVSFHDSCGLTRRRQLDDYVNINGQSHSAMEHELSRENWVVIDKRLSSLASRMAIMNRN